MSSLITPLILCDLHMGQNLHRLSRRLEMSKSFYDVCVCLVNMWYIRQHSLLGCFRLFHSKYKFEQSLDRKFWCTHISVLCPHTHTHTQIQTSIQDLQIWAELLKRAIQPSGKESSRLPFCTEEDPVTSLCLSGVEIMLSRLHPGVNTGHSALCFPLDFQLCS